MSLHETGSWIRASLYASLPLTCLTSTTWEVCVSPTGVTKQTKAGCRMRLTYILVKRVDMFEGMLIDGLLLGRHVDDSDVVDVSGSPLML